MRIHYLELVTGVSGSSSAGARVRGMKKARAGGRRHSRGPRVRPWTAPAVPPDALGARPELRVPGSGAEPTAAQELPEPPDLAGHRGHRKNRLWGGGENQTWGRGRSCGSGVVPVGAGGGRGRVASSKGSAGSSWEGPLPLGCADEEPDLLPAQCLQQPLQQGEPTPPLAVQDVKEEPARLRPRSPAPGRGVTPTPRFVFPSFRLQPTDLSPADSARLYLNQDLLPQASTPPFTRPPL